MQHLLNVHAGKKIVDEDGKIGSQTTKAVKRFQAKNDLPLTGTFDKATAALLSRKVSGGIGIQVLPPPGSQAQNQVPEAGSGRELQLSPWWMSPPLLADKQGMSPANRDMFETLSSDLQQSIAWQSLTTNRSMEEIMNAMHGGG